MKTCQGSDADWSRLTAVSCYYLGNRIHFLLFQSWNCHSALTQYWKCNSPSIFSFLVLNYILMDDQDIGGQQHTSLVQGVSDQLTQWHLMKYSRQMYGFHHWWKNSSMSFIFHGKNPSSNWQKNMDFPHAVIEISFLFSDFSAGVL